MSIERTLNVGQSGTPLEKEYATVKEALARCAINAVAFDPVPYELNAISAACNMWKVRMEVEHRSTTVFAQLASQLMEANASLDSKVVMLRMAQDELRHTENCADVVVALGGSVEVVTDVECAPLALHRTCTPEERALRNVIYTTCMSEMVAIARFVDTLDEMSDPFLRDRTRLLLADEILHGQFGFHYLQSWQSWFENKPDVIGNLERYLTHAFAVIEEVLAGPPVAPYTRTPDQIALGLPEPHRSRDIFYQTMEHATVPGIERFGIDAGKAWRGRKRLG
jgi:hypothetical protein